MDYKFLLNFLISFLTTLLLVPLNRKLSLKLDVVSYPTRERDAHIKPTARMGGLSIGVGFFVATLIFMPFMKNFDLRETGLILLGAFVIFVVGILDDIYNLKPVYKLGGQILAAILCIAGGVTIDFMTVPVKGGMMYFTTMVSAVVTFFWIVGIINAMNLIDGLDGLAAGISTIAAICFMIIAFLNGNSLALVLTISLAGATLGFLPYNFNPAKIFMGDTGSMLLGYVLAISAVEGLFKGYILVTLVAPIIILGVPIFDTLCAIIRRIVNRRPISEGDKKHIHHKLMEKGFSHKNTVITLYLISICFGVTGILVAAKDIYYAFLTLIILLGLVFLITEDPSKHGDEKVLGGVKKYFDKLKNYDTINKKEEKKGENNG